LSPSAFTRLSVMQHRHLLFCSTTKISTYRKTRISPGRTVDIRKHQEFCSWFHLLRFFYLNPAYGVSIANCGSVRGNSGSKMEANCISVSFAKIVPLSVCWSWVAVNELDNLWGIPCQWPQKILQSHESVFDGEDYWRTYVGGSP
jgi:hypothetical protein